ncbi:hypothetical protein P8452_07984 [Trifolium repens]|nr:hypothetical protein P8452_07984 [Trifolium repens]
MPLLSRHFSLSFFPIPATLIKGSGDSDKFIALKICCCNKMSDSSDESSNESDATSEMEIEVQPNIRHRYVVATVVAAFMVTNHVLKYVVKEKKTTSILSGSVHDAKILMDTLRKPDLKFPYPPEDNEQSYNDGNGNGVSNRVEWQNPTQADVRYIEEIRNTIRDQLPRQMRHRHH